MMQEMVTMAGFESDLRMLFKPIEPNPFFIEKLADRLNKPKSVRIEKAKNAPLILLLFGGGLAIGAFAYVVFRIVRKIIA